MSFHIFVVVRQHQINANYLKTLAIWKTWKSFICRPLSCAATISWLVVIQPSFKCFASTHFTSIHTRSTSVWTRVQFLRFTATSTRSSYCGACAANIVITGTIYIITLVPVITERWNISVSLQVGVVKRNQYLLLRLVQIMTRVSGWFRFRTLTVSISLVACSPAFWNTHRRHYSRTRPFPV